MDDGSCDAPPSRPRGVLPSRPEERTTPVADAAVDYAPYIAASGASKAIGYVTARIDVAELNRLVDETRRTGSTKRPRELAQAAAQAAARQERRGRGKLWALGGLAVFAGAAFWLRDRAAALLAPPAAATTSTSTAAEQTPTPPPAPRVAAAIPVTMGNPVGVPQTPPTEHPASAEDQARAALDRLRSGLGACVRDVRGLPGSSPAVPSSLAALKGGPYTASPAEWRTPVWSCAHFQVRDGMPFQLQWQLLKPGADGIAVAWIDADGDGVADRAIGFHITIGPRGEPAVGEIEPVPPTHPVVVVH